MPRRLSVECEDGHRGEIILGIKDKLPDCPGDGGTCGKPLEVVWDQKGPQGAPGFRVQGATKNFR